MEFSLELKAVEARNHIADMPVYIFEQSRICDKIVIRNLYRLEKWKPKQDVNKSVISDAQLSFFTTTNQRTVQNYLILYCLYLYNQAEDVSLSRNFVKLVPYSVQDIHNNM